MTTTSDIVSRRHANLRRLTDALGQSDDNRRDVAAWIDEMLLPPEAGVPAPDHLRNRYLVVPYVTWKVSFDNVPGPLDETGAESCSTLNDVRSSVAVHVFDDDVAYDYTHEALVLDLDEGVEVRWEKVEEVRFLTPGPGAETGTGHIVVLNRDGQYGPERCLMGIGLSPEAAERIIAKHQAFLAEEAADGESPHTRDDYEIVPQPLTE